MNKIIFHIDVNSAYLSWTAVYQKQHGKNNIDIRTIPSIIGGNTEERHGIVLAKSIPAKEYNIETGETILSALIKCRDLKIFPPNYDLFMKCSNDMYQLLCQYSPLIQRYSVDEVFMDMSHFNYNYMEKANEIKDRIEKELGFTVNIGISTNKLLAKMASDFKEKNAIHTLFKEEISKKLWPLDVGDLFMVGKATKKKLWQLNIKTIGELAKVDVNFLKSKLKSHGVLIHNYANGIDNSEVRNKNYIEVKGIGNSITMSHDVKDREEALKILLSLIETAAMRLRNNDSMCSVIVVSIKSSDFYRYSHQKTLNNVTDSTEIIFREAKKIFDNTWKGENIRQLGIRLTNLCDNEFYQRTFFDDRKVDKLRAIDRVVDNIRNKYGSTSIIRSTLINSEVKPLNDGVAEGDYPMMGSIL